MTWNHNPNDLGSIWKNGSQIWPQGPLHGSTTVFILNPTRDSQRPTSHHRCRAGVTCSEAETASPVIHQSIQLVECPMKRSQSTIWLVIFRPTPLKNMTSLVRQGMIFPFPVSGKFFLKPCSKAPDHAIFSPGDPGAVFSTPQLIWGANVRQPSVYPQRKPQVARN